MHAEIERLKTALATANANHERFEREWYLRGDEIERLQADLQKALANHTADLSVLPSPGGDLVQQMRLAGYHDWASAVERLQRPAHEREPPHCATCECSLVDVGRATQDARLKRIEQLMDAQPGTPEGVELDRLVDEQERSEAGWLAKPPVDVRAVDCPACGKPMSEHKGELKPDAVLWCP